MNGYFKNHYSNGEIKPYKKVDKNRALSLENLKKHKNTFANQDIVNIVKLANEKINKDLKSETTVLRKQEVNSNEPQTLRIK